MSNEIPGIISADEGLFGGKTIQEIASMPKVESDRFLKKMFQENLIRLPDYAALRVNVASTRIQNQNSRKEQAETAIGAGAVALETIGVVASEILNGKTVGFDGHIPENNLFQSIKTRISPDGFDIIQKETKDPKQTAFSIREDGREDSILEILIFQKDIIDSEMVLQESYDQKTSNQKQRFITSVQLSPAYMASIKGGLFELISKMSNLDKETSIEALTGATGSVKKLFSMVTLTETVSEVIEKLGKRAEEERKTEVSNIQSLNQIYTDKLRGDARCLSCETPRIEEKPSCERCGHPLEPRYFKDFRERLAFAGIEI